MENYKSLEAFNYFKSSWIQVVKHINISGVFLAKCDVRPSYKSIEQPHLPWIALVKNGKVIAFHCTCMAG